MFPLTTPRSACALMTPNQILSEGGSCCAEYTHMLINKQNAISTLSIIDRKNSKLSLTRQKEQEVVNEEEGIELKSERTYVL
jgi:hypothetical protein